MKTLSGKTIKLSEVEILEEIKDDMYSIGKKCVNSFGGLSDIVSIRGANIAYRCSMQAIRDKCRYHIKK